MTRHRSIELLCAAALLTACGLPVEQDYPDQRGPRSGVYTDRGSVFGDRGLSFGGGQERDSEAAVGIGVNSFLWRASLETLAFMPLGAADSFGGVIITDWYSPPETPEERFKATVYILDRRLRADGVKVSVFRQLRDGRNQWQYAAVGRDTIVGVENAILTRARELRIAAIPADAG